MKITDDLLPILENLEFSVLEVWRAHPEMSDYAALRAYETAAQYYRAEARGKPQKLPELKGVEAEAFEAVKAMCEFELGRAAYPNGEVVSSPAISLELLLDCLRELGRSVERHTRVGGRQGYLTFINDYIP